MATDSIKHVAGIDISVDGTPLDQGFQDNLVRVEVNSEIGASDTSLVRITDPGATRVDSHPFQIGKALEIRIGGIGDRSTRPVFKGRITAMAPEFAGDGCTIAIRAHDDTPKLMANVQHRVFENQSHEEIVSRVASDAGLRRGRVDRGAGERQKRVIQADETDHAFCRRLAHEIGWDFTVTGETFDFTRRTLDGSAVSLTFGEQLLAFAPRVSAIQQVAEVQVTGWDATTKQKIAASARSPELASSIGLSRDQVANGSGGVLRIPDRAVATQAEAQSIAQGALNEIAQGYLVADGAALGDPRLRAGTKITVTGVGRQFSGDYVVSSATHVFRGGKGYETRFTSRGKASQKLVELPPARPRRG
jgi:phage protein D